MSNYSSEIMLLDPPADKEKQNRICLIAIFLTMIATAIFAILAFVFALQSDRDIVPSTLPQKYLVPDEYILPPSNQMNIGTCWAFGTMFLLESQYRAQGIANGCLDKNEYVTFSAQAYFTWLGQKCQEHPEAKACKYGGISHNSSEDGEAEQLYYYYKTFPELAYSILPESVCPYRMKPSEDDPAYKDWSYFWCPGMDDAIKSNPIKFKIKNITSVTQLTDMKRLLLSKKRPLAISAPLLYMKYWVPCTDSNFNSTRECVNGLYECPTSLQFNSTYCYPYLVDARIRDGNFVTSNRLENVAEMGGHVMDVVGYNDDWVWRNRNMHEDTENPSTGGIILHNSWRAEGHSVEYLMGKRSDENENVICPNHMVPTNWIPSTFQCTRDNINIDFSTCLNGTVTPIRGYGIPTQPDILKCVETPDETNKTKYCDPNRFYVIDRIDDHPWVVHRQGGLDEVHLISMTKDDKGTYSDFKQMVISSLPFWSYSAEFAPVNKVENDPQQCGYWIISYQTLDNMRRISFDLMDNFRVSDIEVEFEKSSYAKCSSSKKYNFDFLKQSTFTLNKTTFDGPLPYDKVY